MRRQAMGRSGCGRSITTAVILILALMGAATATRADECLSTTNTVRLSVSTAGVPGDGRSELPAPNADASVVAFKSLASNLIAGTQNDTVNVFVRDRANCTTQQVSVSAIPGQKPDDESFPPAVDGSGRFVAFSSKASNLVIGDFNVGTDLFVRDRQLPKTDILTRIPVLDVSVGGSTENIAPSVSADGCAIAFTSKFELTGLDTDHNEANDVFVHASNASTDAGCDRSNGTIELISVVGAGGGQGSAANAPSAGTAISDDGRFVVFCSEATNLLANTPAQLAGIYVRDRCVSNGASLPECVPSTERVGTLQTGHCGQRTFAGAIGGPDGRYVAFASDLPDAAAGDTNAFADIFVRDRATSGTMLVSQGAHGESAGGPSFSPSISDDGRFIAFQSSATNLSDPPSNGKSQVFVVDFTDGVVRPARLVSVSNGGTQADGDCNAPQISADGLRVVFESDASNLAEGDSNNAKDVFAAINPPTPTPTATATPTIAPTEPTSTPTITPTAATQTPTSTPTGSTTVTPTGTQGATVTPTTTVPVNATPTSTATVSTGGSTPTPSFAATPTRTTTGTGGGGGGTGGGGGGGCSCGIDPASESTPFSRAAAALGVPLVLLALRTRRRRSG